MECIENGKLSGATKYGASRQESKHYFHGFLKASLGKQLAAP
jgi:hypothetical protein